MTADVQEAEIVQPELKPSRTERRISALESDISWLKDKLAESDAKVDALESQYTNMIHEMKRAAAKQMLDRPEVRSALEDQLADRIDLPGMPSTGDGKINAGGVTIS